MEPFSAAVPDEPTPELSLDHRLAALAANQRGVASRAQLTALGLSKSTIDTRVGGGLLHVVAPGVYAVGHPGIGRAGRAMAALLQAGEGSALSHESAARFWRMKGRSNEGPIHVSVGTRNKHAVSEGIVLHRPRNFTADLWVVERGLGVTTPERTVLDLLPSNSVVELTRMLEQMVTKLGRSPDDLHTWGHDVSARHGRGKLLEALDWVAGPTVIRSEFETLFRSVCQEAGLPAPVTNWKVGRWELDAAWIEEAVAVELDSWQFHGGRWQFHQDRKKGLAISKAGFELIRLSWWQLKRERSEVVEALRYALARGQRRRLANVA